MGFLRAVWWHGDWVSCAPSLPPIPTLVLVGHRSGMLRRRTQEEDSAALIDMAPGAGKGDSYGSTANTLEVTLPTVLRP